MVVLLPLACGDDSSSGEASAATAASATSADILVGIIATCADVSGAVEIRRHGATFWEPVTVGAVLRDGDWIRSGAGASARLRLQAGGRLDLEENSVLLLEAGTAAASGAVRVSLESGSASGVLEAGSSGPVLVGPADHEVARIAAEPGSAPTEFRLRSTPEGVDVTTSARPPDDVVAVAEEPPTEVPSEPVDSAPARPRQREATRRPRIDFPESLSPRADARVRCAPSVTLTWRAVTGATGYRVAIAHELTFKSVVKFVELGRSKTSYTFKPVGPGAYAWRVGARGRGGRYSEYGFARRVHCTP
jgi:hypothetical protein